MDGSGTVGPEAITLGSSPGTSEIASVTTRAGCAAAANRPPEKAERCRRMQFISWIVAPEASSALFTAIRSSNVSPGAGSVVSEDPPPETKNSTRSSAPAPRATASNSAAALAPAASGTGWEASNTRTRRVG